MKAYKDLTDEQLRVQIKKIDGIIHTLEKASSLILDSSDEDFSEEKNVMSTKEEEILFKCYVESTGILKELQDLKKDMEKYLEKSDKKRKIKQASEEGAV